jgi:hypothetical protein
MAIYYSKQTGDWSSSTTWLTSVNNTAALEVLAGTAITVLTAAALSASYNAYLSSIGNAGDYPRSTLSGTGDKIIIRGGYTVTYDVSGCYGDQTSTFGQGPSTTTSTALRTIPYNAIVLNGGTLKASRTVNTELTACGNITIGLSGVFDWGTTTDPLTTNANVYLHYMTDLGGLSSSIGAAGLYLYGSDNNLQYFNNAIYINGKPKTRNTTLSSSAVSGSTILTLVSAASTLGWAVGDKLTVATESITGVGTAITTVATTILASTEIKSITGNQITISPGLNTFRSAGTSVGNLNSNVTIKSAYPLYPSYGIFVNSSQSFICDISNCKLESMGNGIAPNGNIYGAVGWNPYYNGINKSTGSQSSTPVGMLTINVPNTVTISQSATPTIKLIGISFENTQQNLSSQALGATPPSTYAISFNGKWTETTIIDNCNFLLINAGSMYGISFNSLYNVNLKNTYLYRVANGITLGTSFPNSIIINNLGIDYTAYSFVNLFGLTMNSTNCKFRGPTNSAGSIGMDSIQNANIKNSIIVSNTSTGNFINLNSNAAGILNISNCSFYNNTTPITAVNKTITGATNRTAQTAQINIYQPNNSTFDYRRFNYFHYSQTDLITRKRGITTYRIKPDVANTEFYNYFTLAGVINTPQRIKGSLRFDSNYGTTYPPSIAFTGAGVDTKFTCTPTANTWQDFDLTLNPTSTDDITITITCQSTLTTGYVWLDGLPIYPFIQNVRHYGFIFDTASDRTVNTLNILTETQVSTLSTISNLDYIYDAASYWSVTNPASSSYIDLCTVNGSVLDFGSKNIIIASTPLSGFTYNSTLSTITINSTTLSAGTNFTTLKTNGLVTLSGSSILSNITVNANVSSLNVSNLNNVTIPKLLSYNTNSPSSVTYTNCAITSATNTGSANVTIKKINSTITYV